SAMGAQLTENGPSVSSILRNSTCLFSGVPRNFYTPSSPLSALHAAPIHTDACKLYSTREATENSGGEDDERDEAKEDGVEEARLALTLVPTKPTWGEAASRGPASCYGFWPLGALRPEAPAR
ncbi:unnamed protein product, partial [Prorocentrum cordatum]